jgi:DNA repair exonuclease SbcCD nuclease subunit
LKFLIFSDLQTNDWKEFSEVLPNGLNSRFADQLNVLDEISTRDADVMIHTGDLFETLSEKINKSVFLLVYDKIARMARKTVVILLMGNHDWLDRTETSHLLEPFKEIDNVIVVDKPSFQQFGTNLGAVFMPYTRYNFSTKLNDMISKYASGFSNNSRKFLFTHQGVSGAMVGPRDIMLREEFSLEAFHPEYFDYEFNGHFHKHQRMLSNFVIVGSPIQRDFGERNDKKGYLLFDTETLDLVHCETQAPKFFKVEVAENGEVVIPLEYRKDTDFLWVVGQKDLNDAELIREHKHIRIEKKDCVETLTRSDIGITMPKKQQLEKFIAFAAPKFLDRDKLLGVGLNICGKAE